MAHAEVVAVSSAFSGDLNSYSIPFRIRHVICRHRDSLPGVARQDSYFRRPNPPTTTPKNAMRPTMIKAAGMMAKANLTKNVTIAPNDM